jgi:hypothetical protein
MTVKAVTTHYISKGPKAVKAVKVIKAVESCEPTKFHRVVRL